MATGENAELVALDWQVKRYGNIVETSAQMAQYFQQRGAEAQGMLEYWTEERARYLGSIGTEAISN